MSFKKSCPELFLQHKEVQNLDDVLPSLPLKFGVQGY
jgi:hypothetical protein